MHIKMLSESRSMIFSCNYAVVLILIFTLSVNFLIASGHDLQRCTEIVALGLVATVLLMRIGKGYIPAVSSSIALLLMTFFGLGLVSTLFADSSRHAVYELTCFFLLVGLVFSIATDLAQDVSCPHGFIQWVGIACGLYSARILIEYAAALVTGFQPDWSVVTAGFSNPRFLNHVQTALLPLVILLYVKTPQASRWRRLWLVLAAFWWSLLFVTEARATILAMVAACTFTAALRRRHARSFVVAMGRAALLGLVMYALGFILLPLLFGLQPVGLPSNVLERTVANPSSDRSYLWKHALHLIAEHPWLGVGPQHFAHEGATLYKGAHPHNWLLQIASEWGIPALLCLLSVIILGARALVRSSARLAKDDLVNQQMAVGLITACSAIFVDALFSGVLVMPQSQLSIALVLGIAYAWVRQQQGTQTVSCQSRFQRLLLGGVVAASLCGLIWSIAPDFLRHARNDALSPAEQSANKEQHWPRMWEAGYF